MHQSSLRIIRILGVGKIYDVSESLEEMHIHKEDHKGKGDGNQTHIGKIINSTCLHTSKLKILMNFT